MQPLFKTLEGMLLEKTGQYVSGVELMSKMQCDREGLQGAVSYLRNRRNCHVVVRDGDYALVVATNSTPRFEIEDMWRGWVNPLTGIIPPRLGLDENEN